MFRSSVIIAVIMALSGSMPAFAQNPDDLVMIPTRDQGDSNGTLYGEFDLNAKHDG